MRGVDIRLSDPSAISSSSSVEDMDVGWSGADDVKLARYVLIADPVLDIVGRAFIAQS